MPSLLIHSESVLVEAQWLGRWQSSWTMSPLTLIDSDSKFLGRPVRVEVAHASDPVVADERIGEAQKLSREGRVGHRLGISRPSQW